MGLSYLLASVVPLAPYFFLPVRGALVLSISLTALVLLGLGAFKGRLAKMSLWRSAAEVVAIGIASAAGGYLLGTLVPLIIGK